MSFNLLEKRLQFAAQSPIHRDVHLTLNNTLNLAPNLVISPREFSHDDGKESGLFLGGLGAPNFSRDLDGFFARWHLESGAHVQHQMEESGFLIAWQEESEGKTKTRVFSLDNRAIEGDLALENKDDLSSALPEIICEKIADLRRRTSLIYPFLYEEYGSESLPFTVIIESFSPIIADDEETSSLPVSFFNVSIKAHENAHNLRVGVFFSWAHLSGWNAGLTTTCDRSKTPYPAQFSAGNSAKKGDKISAKNEIQSLSIIQTRQENRAVANSLEGQALIFVASAHKNAQLSYETCMKARGNRIGKAVHEQEYTLGFARHFFAQNLTLPQSDLTWNAHWDEALASAVCGAVNLKPNESATFNFGVVLDYPLVRFGKNRLWEARYTRRFGASGQNAQAIANTAFAELKNYQQTLYTAQQKHLEKHAPRLGKTLSLGLLNELYFLSGGGSVWVNQEAKLSNLPAPRLGNGEHFACLEGFDIGYYYYNTLDLWVYAFYAFSLNFPHIAETIFADYLAAASVKMPEMRMIYRDEQMRPMMEEGKLPHDFGAAPEDPWHDLNGYQMRDDCNAWLDHNPTFLISFFLHCRTQQRQLTKVEWQSVKKIALFMQSQSTGENGKNGLPLHQAFGDSTWDNIGLRGICAHSGAATLAAISAMISWGLRSVTSSSRFGFLTDKS